MLLVFSPSFKGGFDDGCRILKCRAVAACGLTSWVFPGGGEVLQSPAWWHVQ